MRRAIAGFVLALGLFSGQQSSAQNTLCATPPLGDSSNRCASTAFVQNTISTYGVWTLSGGNVYRPTGFVGVGGIPSFIFDANVLDNANNKIRLANTTSAGSGQSGSILATEVLGARGDGDLSFGGRFGASYRRTDGTAIASGTGLGWMAFGGQWGTDQTFQAAKVLYPASIVGVSEGSFTSASAMPTALSFRTGLVGEAILTAGSSYGTERMRITSAGVVAVTGALTASTFNGNTITTGTGTLTLDTTTALVASAVPRKVATMAALIAIPASDTSTYYLQGYYAAGDGGEGLFVWNSGSSATADNGVVVNPTGNAGAGRRIRTVYSTVVNVAWWGLKCDWNGSTGTDDSSAFQKAVDYLATIHGGRALVPRGCRSAIAATILVQSNNTFIAAEGGPSTRRNGFSTDTDCNVSLYWSGAASGVMMRYSPNVSSGNKLTLTGGGVQGLCFYGRGVAGRGLYILSVISGVWSNLYFESFTSRSMEVTVDILVNTGESCDSQFNLIQNIRINNLVPAASTAGHGFVAGGVADNTRPNNGCNYSYNTAINIDSTTDTGTPFLLHGPDNNKWLNMRASRNAGVYGIVYDYTDVAVGPPNVGGAEYWYGVGGSFHIIKGGGIFIYGLDKGNGSPDPVMESGTTASWIDSDLKVSHIYQLSFANILSCTTTLVTSASGVVSCGGTAYMPIAGGTFTGGIGFSTTNTLDIGTSATVLAPRTVYAGTSFVGPVGTFTTSVAAGGCTIGSNAFCATGTANISGNVTHGTSALLLWSTDTNLSRNAAGIVQFGTTTANASGGWLAATGNLSTSLIIGAGGAITSSGAGGALGTGAFAAAGITALTGDVTATGPGSSAATLASVISAGGPTGSATVAPIITYDAKGRLTTVSSATITPAIGSVTGLGANVATALGTAVGSAGAFVVNGGALGSPSSVGTLPAHTLGGTIAGGGNQINNVIIGTSTPLAGSFTTIGASGQITSTVSTGSAPFVVASTTQVANLNAATAGNASTVTTNANLTGPITSSGNATSIASQTGTGTTFAMSASPTLTGTPAIAAATGTSVALGGCTIGTLLLCATGAGGVSPIAELTTQAAGAYGLLRIINTNANGEASIGFRDSSDSDPTSWVIGKSVGGADLFGFYYGATMMTISTTGGVSMPSLAQTSAAQTGTVCWATGTGLLTVDTTTTCLLSSGRFKHGIAPLTDSLSSVLALRPVAYTYNDDQFIPGEQVGFIAEDVAKIDPRLVSMDQDGNPRSVRYQQLTAVLAGALQTLKADNDNLRMRLERLEAGR